MWADHHNLSPVRGNPPFLPMFAAQLLFALYLNASTGLSTFLESEQIRVLHTADGLITYSAWMRFLSLEFRLLSWRMAYGAGQGTAGY
ncbi:hypothetical protein J3F83DRAFT_753824 [Trichoderma novae-zelandiae]